MTKSTYGNPDAKMVLIQLVDEHDLETMDTELMEIRRLTDEDFYLIAMKVRDWNNDLSPWEAPAVFGRENFGKGSDDTLKEVLKNCCDLSKNYIIGGYSLAGLFALWAVTKTNVFKTCAAASPSVWFPGFVEYMNDQRIYSERIYLSLGDKEENTRNPVMATVGEKIRELYELLEKKGVHTILEWNKGNHFLESDIRMAKAFAWALNAINGK